MTTRNHTRPDLNDLKIEEKPARRRGGGLLLVLLFVLVPGAFALGYYLKGGGTAFPGGTTSVTVEVVTEPGAVAPDRNGFGEGGWIEVPSYHPLIVSTLIPGRVEKLLVLEGAAVAKGQLVAELYAADLEDTLRLREAEVAEAQAALDLLVAGYRVEDVAKAAAEVRRQTEGVAIAEKVASRTAGLVPAGAASAEQLERDLSEVEVAKARLAATVEEHHRLTAGFRPEEVEKARAALARTEANRDLARSHLSYATVTSPAAGVVLSRFVTAGTFVTASDPRIVSLYDPEDLQVRVDVRQENATRITIGQRALISTEAEPGKTYEGIVIRVEPLADLKKNTVQAKIRIESPGPALRPEMICRVRFLEAEEERSEPGERPALTVPATAVTTDGGGSSLFLVRSGRAARVTVRLGEAAGGRVTITAGIAPGDRVITAPPAGLSDGDRVSEVSK
jgi:multidrug efflux pump subunit AcrA (membrane-fusion protein)